MNGNGNMRCLPLVLVLLLLSGGCRAGMFSQPAITPQQLQEAEDNAQKCRAQLQADADQYRQEVRRLRERIRQLETSAGQVRRKFEGLVEQELERERRARILEGVFLSLDESGRLYDVVSKSDLRLEMSFRTASERLQRYSEIYERSLQGAAPGWEPQTARDRYFEARFNFYSLLYSLLLFDRGVYDWSELSQLLEKAP